MTSEQLDQAAVRDGAVSEIAELGHSPSERDRVIYQAICVENRAAVAVGREFDLAATTVRNIAHQTQRKLARRQHELDQRGTAEGLADYFSEFRTQVDQLYRAWEASCEPVDRVQRLVTRKGRPEGRPGEEGLSPRVSCEQVVEREVPLYRPARPDVRCMALANRIVRDMLALEQQYQEKAREARPAQPAQPAAAASPAPVASPAPAAPPLEVRVAREDTELEEIRAMLPPIAKGHTREFTRADNGPWQVRERPPRSKPMSRREQHRLAQERERERAHGGERPSQPPPSVSAAPQVPGRQGAAQSHLPPGSVPS